MNIICWGTGKIADACFLGIESCVHDYCNIIAFVDSDKCKWNSSYYGYTVLSPGQVQCIDHDYILVLSNHEEEIERTANEIGLYNVISLTDFSNMYIDHRCSEKNVVFYGDRYAFEYYEYILPYIFNHYRFCELQEALSIHKDEIVLICPPRHLSPMDKEKYQNEAKEQIGIDCLVPDQYEWFISSDRYVSMGDLNSDKTFYIIHGQDPKSGWGNILIRVLQGIGYAEKNGMIPVIDMKTIKNQYLSKTSNPDTNSWTLFFEPINEYSLDEVYKSKKVIISGNKGYRSKAVSAKRIRLNNNTRMAVKKEYDRLFPEKQKTLGVVYRGTDYYVAYNHPHPTSIDIFIKSIQKKMRDEGYTLVFIASEIEQVIIQFKKVFGDKARYVNQMRYSQDERRYLADVSFDRENDGYYKGIEYLTVLEILSTCDEIYGESNATIECAKLLRETSFQ